MFKKKRFIFKFEFLRRVPVYREVTVEVPQYEKRCCVGYTGSQCLERVVEKESSQSQVESPEQTIQTCDIVDTCTAGK